MFDEIAHVLVEEASAATAVLLLPPRPDAPHLIASGSSLQRYINER